MHCKTRENWPFVFRFSGYFNLWRRSSLKNSLRRFLGFCCGLEFRTSFQSSFPSQFLGSCTKSGMSVCLCFPLFPVLGGSRSGILFFFRFFRLFRFSGPHLIWNSSLSIFFCFRGSKSGIPGQGIKKAHQLFQVST